MEEEPLRLRSFLRARATLVSDAKSVNKSNLMNNIVRSSLLMIVVKPKQTVTSLFSLLVLIAFIVPPTAVRAQSSCGVTLGGIVQVINSNPQGLRVRSCASTNSSCSPVSGSPVFDGALGTVQMGPTIADGYRWWYIQWYDANCTAGWSVEAISGTCTLQSASSTLVSLSSPSANASVSFPQTFSWAPSCAAYLAFATSSSPSQVADFYTSGGSRSLSSSDWSSVKGIIGSSSTYYWTAGDVVNSIFYPRAAWRPFTEATSCTYSIYPTSISPSAAGTSSSVSVTAGTGCSWTANSGANWITITSGSSGTASGSVYYTVAPNPGAARSGSVTIAGQTFTVYQGALSVGVTSPVGSENWAAGSTHSVTWTVTGSTANVAYYKVALSTDGGATWPAAGTANDLTPNGIFDPSARSFNWTIANSLNTSQARIRVRALASDSTILAENSSPANFTVSPQVTGGTWTALTSQPGDSIGICMLLSDGTVLAEGSGANWYKLTPTSNGHYVNGIWTARSSSSWGHQDGSTAVLTNGNVYVGGGENGTGIDKVEIYNPVSDSWSVAINPTYFGGISDGNAMMMPDGQVLIEPQNPSQGYAGLTFLFNPKNNTFSQTAGAPLHGIYESTWVKLPNNNVLTIDSGNSSAGATTAQMYNPNTGFWQNAVTGGTVPNIWPDMTGSGDVSEMGPGFLLPNGNVIFFGGNGVTAVYNNGTWSQSATVPLGLGMKDAPGAMMVNGKILLAVSPQGVNSSASDVNGVGPTSFYEYDYTANNGAGGYTAAPSPGNGISSRAQALKLLDLPDGTVLLSTEGSQLFVYQPDGSPLPSGKPTISGITQNPDGSYHLIGTGLNGISQGASYGDNEQMDSNYPLIRITDGNGNIHYLRTYNWSSTGVMTGANPVSTEFTNSAALPVGTYSLVVIANGISSDPVSFTIQPPPSNISVTINATPTGRTISVDGNTYTAPQTFTWISGSSHTIAITSPQTGSSGVQYVWSSWSDGGAISHAVTPTANTTYTASFTTQYYLTMNAGAGGSVTPTSSWYNSGSVVPISATANSGYTFSSWSGSGIGAYTGTSPAPSVSMNGPITETAAFTGALPDLTVVEPVTVSAASVVAGGTVAIGWTETNQGTVTTSPTYNTKLFLSTSAYGTNYQIAYYGPMYMLAPGASQGYYASALTIPGWIPPGDYYVTAFVDCDQQVNEGSNEGNNIGSSSPAKLTVTPSKVSIGVQTVPTGRTIIVDGMSYTAPQGFSWDPGSQHTIAAAGTQSGGTGTQYVWTDWSDNGAVSHTVSPTSNVDYTADFTTQYYLAMNFGAGGTVSPGSAWYNSGSSVLMSAIANTGYSFNGWSGSGTASYTGNNNPASVTMNTPITEIGTFSALTAPQLSCIKTGSTVSLNWAGSFRLQSCSNLTNPNWTDVGATVGPFSTNMVGKTEFFRLSQDNLTVSGHVYKQTYSGTIGGTMSGSYQYESSTIDGTFYGDSMHDPITHGSLSGGIGRFSFQDFNNYNSHLTVSGGVVTDLNLNGEGGCVDFFFYVNSCYVSDSCAGTNTTGPLTVSAPALNWVPASGVSISGVPGNIRTDTNGFYTASVPYGFSGTVAPVQTGYNFIPIVYSNVTSDKPHQDYIATPNSP